MKPGFVTALILAVSLVAGVLAGPRSVQAQDPLPREMRLEGELEVLGLFPWNWRLLDLDRRSWSAERLRGRVLVVNFWATWCPPCVQELASLERLGERLADTDVHFLLVSHESPGVVERFARRHYLGLPLAVEDERTPPSLGVRGLPTTLIVDRQGRIVLRRYGAADWDQPSVERFLRFLASR